MRQSAEHNARGLIRRAVVRAQRAKVEIVSGTYYGDQGSFCMCPLAALHWSTGHEARYDQGLVERDVAEVLGVSNNWVASFADGFDGNREHRWHDRAAHALGVEFRKSLTPRPYSSPDEPVDLANSIP